MKNERKNFPSDEDVRKLHMEGHRERVKALADKDPDFTFMTETDVLEYALFMGIPRKDTKIIAHRLLDRFGSLFGVVNAPLKELRAVKDMTDTAARVLKLVMPMSRLCLRTRALNGEYMPTPGDALEKFRALFMGRSEEMLALACLDLNDKLLQIDIIEQGAVSNVHFDIGKLVKHALNAGASKIILAHNHPAGGMVPSVEDVNATIKLALTAKSVEITLYDHFIISDAGYVSMYNNGVVGVGFKLYDALNKTHCADGMEHVHEYNTMASEYRLRIEGDCGVVPEPINRCEKDFYEEKKDMRSDTSFENFITRIKLDNGNLDALLRKINSKFKDLR